MKRYSRYATAMMRGAVRGRWFNPVTGHEQGHFFRHNQLSYACCDVLAHLMGGDSAYTPRYMGFIYGTKENPTALTAPTDRNQSWTNLASELADIDTANMQIAPITLTPTLTVDGAATRYASNAIVYSAHTRSGVSGEYGFPLSGNYAGVLANGNYLYHAVLLTKLSAGGTFRYIPVARLSLTDVGQPYSQKPDGLELALDWQISFF